MESAVELPVPKRAIVSFSEPNQQVETFIERVVCNVSDIDDNEMKEVDMGGDKKILLINQKGKFSAIGANCAHYDLPLITGALGEGRIRCPWHGACFNIETGDIEDFPGLDSLPCHQVKINDEGQVVVRAKKSDLEQAKRVKSMPSNLPRTDEIFVIIGGGPSGQTCAETLRQNAFKGRILMICKEEFLPYDRVSVNRYLDWPIERLQLRSKEFYDENSIEVSLNTAATLLDPVTKEIWLSSGSKLKYDKVYIATGSRSKAPSIPGWDLANIFTVQDLNDAHAIHGALKTSSHVVILGSGFIGLETAEYCVGKVGKVTIISRDAAPLTDSFGEEIGKRIMKLLQTHNIEFIMNSGIKSFLAINQEDCLSAVKLLDDRILKADVCIVGIGSELNTDFLHDSGLTINENKSIDTNIYLQTSVPNVYVGGDIANSPIFVNNNELATVGHYGLAQYHGKIAALNMMGTKTELRAVPFFFTYLFGHCFNYTGYGKATEIFIDGDLDSLSYVAFYFDDTQRVIAMSSCQPNSKIPEFAEKLAQGEKIMKKDLWKLLGELIKPLRG